MEMTNVSARAYFEPHSEPRPDLSARDQFIEDNRRMLEQEKRKTLRLGIIAGIICSMLMVGVLMANIYEQSHMTARQAQTIEHIVN
jgi:tetrahydromethanopterin S-methyltransferase subunit F